MSKFKTFLSWIAVGLFFFIPIALLVAYTILFTQWFNALDHVQHFMY